MKIAAIVQFYLDAVFPRDDTWSVWPGVQLRTGTFTAHVRPWKPSVEPLFPNEIDQSLAGSSFSLRPVYMPGGSVSRTIADTVVDRIQVELRWEEDTTVVPPSFDVDLAHSRSVDAANLLIEHIRVSARASSVPRVRRAWRPQDGRYYLLTPWTIAVFDSDTGDPLPVFGEVNGMLSLGAVRAPETGVVGIEALEDSLRSGVEPSLPISLLVDAETAVEALALREAILAIASACEVAANVYIDSRPGTNADAYRRSLPPRSSFATKFYRLAPANFSSRSLQQDDPSAFTLIEEMYRERNCLVHSGRMTQRLRDLNPRARQRAVYAYLSAGSRAVDWIMALI